MRIARDNERFAVITAGRFRKLAGPGLLFRPPLPIESWVRLTLGQEGEYVADGLAEFGTVAVPVRGVDLADGDPVRIVAFRDGQVDVSVAGSRTVVCEKCGHEMRIGA